MAGATIENFGNTTLLQLNRPVARGIRSTMRNQPRSQRSSLGKSCLCIRDRTNRPLWGEARVPSAMTAPLGLVCLSRWLH